MSICVSITNMKGGVGKTTITANLGFCLANVHKKRVLLIDVDPQFNLTQYCMNEDEYESIRNTSTKGTVFDIFVPDSIKLPKVLKEDSTPRKQQFEYEIRPRLFLVPSTIELIDFVDQRPSGSERRLSTFIEALKSEYDYILIDCPPTSTILSRAAYLSSDSYLIPMGMDYFSVMGIPLLQRDITNFTETYGKQMRGLGIIKARYLDWTKIAQKHKAVVEQFANKLRIPLFVSSFQQRQDVQNAIADRKFILEYNRYCDSARDIMAITEEFLTLSKGEK
jgi:chromosome partitioning protein